MCDDCESPEYRAAHVEFEEALVKFLEKIDMADGVTVDWVLSLSQSIIEDDGRSNTMTAWVPRLDQPHYRSKGLMHEVLDTAQARDIAHKILHEN